MLKIINSYGDKKEIEKKKIDQEGQIEIKSDDGTFTINSNSNRIKYR